MTMQNMASTEWSGPADVRFPIMAQLPACPLVATSSAMIDTALGALTMPM